MRTTLTLDDDLARTLKDLAHERDEPFKQVVNDTLRAGLKPSGLRTPYKTGPGWIPDIGETLSHLDDIRDMTGDVSMTKVAAALENEEILNKMREGR